MSIGDRHRGEGAQEPRDDLSHHCGWKKPELPPDSVRRYWRDVHSPAIVRRPGIWEYRYNQFDAVRPVFAGLAGVEQACPADEQLMWLLDVRYADDATLAIFGGTPVPKYAASCSATST